LFLIHAIIFRAQAEWWCRYDESESGTSGFSSVDDAMNDVKLFYRVNDTSSDAGYRFQHHSSPELLDFQSNVVLTKSSDVDGPLHITIDKFIIQFSWMRRMAAVLHSLHGAGHFDFYPKYSFSIPVSSEIVELKTVVEEKEATLVAWRKEVLAIRDEFYFINYYEVKRFPFLISALENLRQPPHGEKGLFESLIAEYICMLNVDTAEDVITIAKVTESMCTKWNQLFHDSKKSSLLKPTTDYLGTVDILRFLANCLDHSLSCVPVRIRRISAVDCGLGQLKAGIFILNKSILLIRFYVKLCTRN